MPRILIVDDNFTNRQLLIEIVQDLATCDVAENGRVAFDLFSKQAYDLILLDIAMPEVNGLDFLKDVRAFEQSQQKAQEALVPIVMITAYKEPFVNAFNLGCTDYLTKPIDVAELLTVVKKRLKL